MGMGTSSPRAELASPMGGDELASTDARRLRLGGCTAEPNLASQSSPDGRGSTTVPRAANDPRAEPRVVRLVIIAAAMTFLSIFVVLPLVVVFAQAFAKGAGAYFAALADPEALAAIRLTLLVAAISVSLNLVFGLIAAWAIAKFDFSGKIFLISLIDLPFSVSPVISGLVFVLLFGAQGFFGPLLARHDIQVLFAVPGITLATLFVTFPFVARALIPLMQEQGNQEEEAAISLGASGLQTFFRVTLPNIKWGLLYGVLLCNARAMGEFGAVSVVSGHVRGLTNTMPLLVEILYNEYQFVASFAVASLLAMLALITLIAKTVLERRLDEGDVP
jgi:sulfate/thiosulfate transport system permease protein